MICYLKRGDDVNTFNKIFSNTLGFLEGFTYEQLTNSTSSTKFVLEFCFIEILKTIKTELQVLDTHNIHCTIINYYSNIPVNIKNNYNVVIQINNKILNNSKI